MRGVCAFTTPKTPHRYHARIKPITEIDAHTHHTYISLSVALIYIFIAKSSCASQINLRRTTHQKHTQQAHCNNTKYREAHLAVLQTRRWDRRP